MFWLLIATLLIPLYLARMATRRLLNPSSLLIAWWSLWLVLGRHPFFDLYVPSDGTYALLILSVHGWCLGFCAACRVPGRMPVAAPGARVSLLNYLVGLPRISRPLLLVLAGCAIFLTFGALRTIGLLGQDGGRWEARAEYYASGGATAFGSAQLGLLRDILVKPLLFAIWGIATARAARTPRKGNLLFFAAVCTLQVVYDLTFLGRGQAVSVVLFVALLFLFGGPLQGKHRLALDWRVSRRLVFTLVVILLLAAIFVITMSVMKAEGREGALQYVLARYVTYWMLPFTLFDQRDVILAPDDPFVYSIGGFLDLLILLGRRFGVEYVVPGRSIDLQVYLPIAPDRVGNAFATWCIAFYADMGAVGVFLLPLAFGAVVGMVYGQYLRTRQASFFVLLVFLYQATIMGVLEWQLSWNEGTCSLLLLVLLAITRCRNAQIPAGAAAKALPSDFGREP